MVAVGVIVGAALAVRASGAAGSRTAVRTDGARHVVRAGDTLWALARARVGPEGDPRPLVQEIRAANGLGTAAIVPGMELSIPRP